MTEPANEIQDLLATVQERRATEFPDLDADLVAAIVDVQRSFAEDRAEARKRTEQLVNQWVSEHPVESA